MARELVAVAIKCRWKDPAPTLDSSGSGESGTAKPNAGERFGVNSTQIGPLIGSKAQRSEPPGAWDERPARYRPADRK